MINRIITFMLTPGRWLETGEFWDGLFQPNLLAVIVHSHRYGGYGYLPVFSGW